jgi:hypothetical protein
MDEDEWADIEAVARRHGQTVSDWVRTTLRAARRDEPTRSADRKLAALRAAMQFDAPTADIDQMLAEIESGYRTELPE